MDIGKFTSEQEDSAWYKMPGTDEVKVKIKRLSPAEQRKIIKASTSRKFKRGQAIERVDEEALNAMYLDAMVVDWSGIERDGSPLECTTENKRLLDDRWTDFTLMWNGVLGEHMSLQGEIEEAEQGN